MEHIGNFFNFLNGYLWAPAMLVFIIASSVYFSVRLRFTQVRNFGDMVKCVLSGQRSEHGISTFASFWTTMAGRVGVGNIAGVALAIYMGGPGAVFWMWVTAIFLAATSFTECTLAQIYKIKVDGEYRGGTYYCAENALGWKWYGMLFAIVSVIAMMFLLPAAQANMISEGLQHSLKIPPVATGAVGAVFLGIIIIGGIKRISAFSSFVVPLKVGLYLLLAITVLIVHASAIPAMFVSIFTAAFNQGAVFGGMMGSAISWGVRRATFASGAGMGIEPPAAAAAEVDHPAKQGLANSCGIYMDIVVCTCTALMILVTDCFNTASGYIGSGSDKMAELAASGQNGVVFTQEAVGTFLPGAGELIMALLVVLFAYTTIMSCSYHAETCMAYIFYGDSREKIRKTMIMAMRIVMVITYFIFSTTSSDTAWAAADLACGLMVWLNVFILVLLFPKARAVLKDYEDQRKAGLKPFFDPDKVGIKHADLWKEINQEKIAASKSSGM